jgi:hypothetical protein
MTSGVEVIIEKKRFAECGEKRGEDRAYLTGLLRDSL